MLEAACTTARHAGLWPNACTIECADSFARKHYHSLLVDRCSDCRMDNILGVLLGKICSYRPLTAPLQSQSWCCRPSLLG